MFHWGHWQILQANFSSGVEKNNLDLNVKIKKTAGAGNLRQEEEMLEATHWVGQHMWKENEG